MKRTLLSLLAVVIVVGISLLAYIHYVDYQNSHPKPVAVDPDKAVITDLRKNLDSANKAEDTLVLQYNSLQGECTKGAQAASKLKALQPAVAIPQPACGAALVQ